MIISAFISEFDKKHFFRVLSTPPGPFQELYIITILIIIIDKGQEEKRMKPVGPVSIDPFADEEFYKPKNALSSSGVKIKYKYN